MLLRSKSTWELKNKFMEESDFVILFCIDIQTYTRSIHSFLCLVESRVANQLPNQMTENFAISGVEEWKSERVEEWKEREGVCNDHAIKFENFLKVYSPVTIFSLYTNVYKLMYGDFTKDEREKSQYQDTICSEGGHVDSPYNVVNPAASQPSEETSVAFPLTEKLFLLLFLG